MTMTKIKQKQQGAVLVVSLLVLLVMTMIGLAAVQTNVLQEKMAGNMHDKNLAFQAAEAGLRAAENRLRPGGFSAAQLLSCEAGNDVALTPTVVVICYELNTDPEPDPLDPATWSASANYTEVDAADYTQVGGQAFPRYFITSIGRQPSGGLVNQAQGTGTPPTGANIIYFRVTARGTGGSVNAQSVLRSYFAVQTP